MARVKHPEQQRCREQGRGSDLFALRHLAFFAKILPPLGGRLFGAFLAGFFRHLLLPVAAVITAAALRC